MRKALYVFVAVAAIVAVLLPSPGLTAGKKIGVLWIGKAGMQKRVLMGFLPELRKIAPDLKVTLKTELKDRATAAGVFEEFQQTCDGIVFLRSNGAKFLAQADPKVPCFVGGCSNPKLLGAVQNLEAPEGKITGVTYYIPYDKRFDAMKAVLPKFRSLALLLEAGHPSVPIDREGTRGICEKRGIAYNEVEAGTLDELIQGAKDLGGKVDLFVLGAQAMVLDNAGKLAKISHASKTPMFAYTEAPVKHGALAGLFASDERLGRMLAHSVVDVVVKGKPVSQVPVKIDPDPCLTINEAEMEFFEVRLPPSVLRNAQLIGPR